MAQQQQYQQQQYQQQQYQQGQQSQQPLKIKFRIISFTGEDPEYPVTELLTQSPQSKGWQSPRFCDYPQEIILQLMSPTRIKQLQFLSHQCKIASKIDIFVYLPDLYSNQQQEDFKFKKLGYLSLDNNERSGFQARELKSVYIDNAAVYIKLLFQKCHSNKYNLFNQVGLIALTIFGETIKTQAERIHNPDPLPKGFESLEYELQFDQRTLERLRVLQQAKEKALKFEDYEEAKRLKDGIERLKQIGTQLSYLEERKAIALQKEDYDSCQIIKQEIERLRNAVTPEALLGKYGEQVSGFGGFNERLPPVERSRGILGGAPYQQVNQVDEMGLRDLQLKERQFSSKSPASFPTEMVPMTRNQGNQGMFPQEKSLEQHPTQGLTNMRQFDLEQQQTRMANKPRKQFQWMENQQQQQQQQVEQQQQQQYELPSEQDPPNLQFHKEQFLEERKLPMGAIAHDEEVIPTIKHKAQPQEFDSGEEQQGGNPYRNREAEDQLEELTEDVHAACVPLLGVLGEICCKKLFSKNWNMRDDGIKWIHEQLKSRRGALQGSEPDQLVAILGAVNFTIADKISSVYMSAVSLLLSTLDRFSRIRIAMKGDVAAFLEVILSNLVERLGESNARVRESAEESFIALAKSSFVDCPLAVKYLIATVVKGGKEEGKKQSKIGSVKHLAGRCKVLTTLINDCGVNSSTGVPLNSTLDFSCNQLEHPNKEVRNAAVKVIVALTRSVGYQKVRPLLNNVKPPQMEILEKEFEKVTGGGHGGYSQQPDDNDDDAEEQVYIETNIGKKKSSKMSAQKPKAPQKEVHNEQNEPKATVAAQSNQVCEFCGKVDRNFQDNQKYDIHLWKECPMLVTCQQCAQIIEISGLTDHLLGECQFKANFRRCARCKEAIAINQFKMHSEELSCNIAKPPNISNRCPLCHCDIPPQEIGWKKHLIAEGCPNNERTTY